MVYNIKDISYDDVMVRENQIVKLAHTVSLPYLQ